MKLNIKDRIIISNILPQKGSYTDLIVKKDLADKIKITQEEIKEYGITEIDGGLKWDSEKEEDKNFDLTELEEAMVKDSFSALDKSKELSEEMLDTYSKFN